MTPQIEGLTEGGPFCLHLAEGADDRAAGEVRQLAELGLLRRS